MIAVANAAQKRLTASGRLAACPIASGRSGPALSHRRHFLI
jgi:hypothetical protein